MSIGIAMTLPDGVLLVADGRRTQPFVSENRHDNDVDKLEKISSTIYAISFGITHATDYALKIIGGACKKESTPERFGLLLNYSVRTGWIHLITNLAPDVDKNDPRMRAALVAGGIWGGEPFIASSLYGTNINPQSILRKNCPFQCIVLGGEKQQAQEMFTRKAGDVIQSFSWEISIGPQNATVSELLVSAASTIREVESRNPDIGGTIRYAIVRKNFPVEKAIWNHPI